MSAADVMDHHPGIQTTYLDSSDRPAQLDERTVAALRTAVGEPDPTLADRGPLVVRPGARLDRATALGVIGLTLEDGSERELDGREPLDLPFGYHWLHTRSQRRRLIVSPGVCVLPPRRTWGWTAQLYATRSRASWGIGDFADLEALTRLARDQGAGFVMVNPLHAGSSTALDAPQQPSPYFPSSRRFFSPLYLAVEQVTGAHDVLTGRLDALAATGRALQARPRIDRDAIWALKRAALREIFDQTRAAHSARLAAWRREHGEPLEEFAAWCVLSERFGAGWRT